MALYCKYAWVVFVFKYSFKSCYAITGLCYKCYAITFSVTGSNSLYLEIFRFFTMFEKKLFRLSAVSDSTFKILPFSLILIRSLMRDLSESKGFTDFQNSLSSVTFVIFKFS